MVTTNFLSLVEDDRREKLIKLLLSVKDEVTFRQFLLTDYEILVIRNLNSDKLLR